MPTIKPSQKQLEALSIVSEGRAQYGSEYPERARRAAARGRQTVDQTWLVDGADVYGAEHTTWNSLEGRGWIRVRHDLLPMKHVTEQAREYTTITGFKELKVLPAHEEPEDPGWRAAVELTAEGAEMLERYGGRG
ncbi:Uncharacterised protein [Mycobacteroides abscessus subsp. massiliense]|uniref:Uncharacterized protein n=2 Tax=Mycobacteroides abscessus TaxID=36809 RepID=A0A1U0Z5N1_9MYCO|nr:Uncharacterised protein [Mycobacteroides abscessus subsp. massiliense]SKT61818.1 Uncharacterised protein [Mycobacteroides abscessus subsp. massiliense]SKT89926.1 Uncharacterised protein [Mycobacteroides abscessus subsp. massiliense]SKX38904.1 Uncharacterised protein [Mycobacteroides abscessus subsp. massiliense]